MDSCADIWYVGVLGDTGAVRNYCTGRPAGKECWFYANSTNRGNETEFARRTFGFWFYKVPFTHQYPWAYRYYTLDPFDDTDGSWGDFVYIYPDEADDWSPSLPALKWEGMREGVDDLRYLATLEAAISAAPASLAAKKTEAINYLSELKQAPQFDIFWEVVYQVPPRDLGTADLSKLEFYNVSRKRLASFITQLLPTGVPTSAATPTTTVTPTATATPTNMPTNMPTNTPTNTPVPTVPPRPTATPTP
ncbi:hypothetical protein COU97_00965, partial [Candidatus Shapirobacteria bacterium CG10_big_fil_rev_8_21_14_0_10_48_15]